MTRPTTPVDPSSRYRAGAGLQPQEWWTVVSPPPELADRCAKLLTKEGVLSAAELEQLVRVIAADEDLWGPLVVVDPQRRRYRLLYEDDRIDVWVLSWMDGQGTGFHDHGNSGVGLCGARGAVIERQFLLPSGATRVEMRPGVARQGGPGYIHSVGWHEGEPAVTIHAYSPPLTWMGQYRASAEGILERHIVHGRQELLDHTIAEVDPSRGDFAD